MVKDMKRYLKWIIVLFAFANLIIAWFYMQYKTELANRGKIYTVNLTAYSDSNCTNIIEAIDWGNFTVNCSKTITIYLKNTGGLPVNITWYTGNWTFYSYNGSEVTVDNVTDYILVELVTAEYLDVNEVSPCTITLTVKDVDYIPFYRFEFTIYIVGTYYA